MNLPKYPVKANDERFEYEFYSEGPKGNIKKTVIYSQIEEDLFNLAFGEWNEKLQKLDDSVRSNNGDRDKILATGKIVFTYNSAINGPGTLKKPSLTCETTRIPSPPLRPHSLPHRSAFRRPRLAAIRNLQLIPGINTEKVEIIETPIHYQR